MPSQADLGEFLAQHEVEIVASLPYYYRAAQADAQRGESIYEQSLDALRRLNRLEYGVPNGRLLLNLVHNPVGAFLPSKQEALEVQFRKELGREGVSFNRLYTITNMPISRFLSFLCRVGTMKGIWSVLPTRSTRRPSPA